MDVGYIYSRSVYYQKIHSEHLFVDVALWNEPRYILVSIVFTINRLHLMLISNHKKNFTMNTKRFTKLELLLLSY